MTTYLLSYASSFSKIPQTGVKIKITFVFKTPLNEICNLITFALKYLTAKRTINFLCVNI